MLSACRLMTWFNWINWSAAIAMLTLAVAVDEFGTTPVSQFVVSVQAYVPPGVGTQVWARAAGTRPSRTTAGRRTERADRRVGMGSSGMKETLALGAAGRVVRA